MISNLYQCYLRNFNNIMIDLVWLYDQIEKRKTQVRKETICHISYFRITFAIKNYTFLPFVTYYVKCCLQKYNDKNINSFIIIFNLANQKASFFTHFFNISHISLNLKYLFILAWSLRILWIYSLYMYVSTKLLKY